MFIVDMTTIVSFLVLWANGVGWAMWGLIAMIGWALYCAYHPRDWDTD